MRAAIYQRISDDEQSKFSLSQQYTECLDLIKKRGYTFMELYEDEGYSAKNMNRPALKRMLSDLEKKKFDVLVVWNTDRLSRDVIDGLTMIKRVFVPKGITFLSVTEDIDTTTPDGLMMLTIRLTFAQRERERNGERVSMGLLKKASTGRRANLGLIYGYEVVDGALKVNKFESEVVNRIFNLYVYKGWGYAKIAKVLNLEGIPSKKSSWWPNTIKGMLLNATYIGKNTFTPKVGQPIIVDGTHEPIIDEELFNLAQQKLNRKKNLEMSRSSYHYPFSSIIKCGTCGGSYTAYYTKKITDKKLYCNYRCTGKKSQICNSPDIGEIKFMKLFFAFFDGLVKEAAHYTPGPSKEAQKGAEKERKRIERELEKLDRRKSNLLEDLGDRIITREDYRTAMADVEKKVQMLKAELEAISPQEEAAAARQPSEVIDFVTNLHKDWDDMEPEDRKFIIQMLFKKIVIKKEDEWKITDIELA